MSLSNVKVSVEKVVLSGAEQPHVRSSGRYSSVSLVGGFLYIYGKLYQYASALNLNSSLVGVLNVRERQWRWIPCPRATRPSPHIFLCEDSLLMLSKNDWAGFDSGKVSRFDLVLEQWSYFETVGTGAGPGERVFFRGDFLEKEKLFVVFGGKTRGLYRDDVHILKVPEKRWFQPKIKGKIPEPRSLHGSCTYQGKIYYYGGWTTGLRRCNDGLHVLTLTKGNTATWSTLKRMNLAMSSSTIVSMGRLLFFCGGFASGNHFNGLQVCDPVTGELRKVPLERAIAKHIGHGVAAFKTPFANTIGLIGGNDALGNYLQLSVSQ